MVAVYLGAVVTIGLYSQLSGEVTLMAGVASEETLTSSLGLLLSLSEALLQNAKKEAEGRTLSLSDRVVE